MVSLKYSFSRVVRRSIGWGIIIASMLGTLIIWLATVRDYTFIMQDPFLFLSKIVVLIGTIGMCLTFVLATRMRLLEDLFLGLDNVYRTHQHVARWSFFLICLHPLFQLMRFIPDWAQAFGLFFPYEWGGLTYGIGAFALFLVLIAVTLWIKIPYHIWKRTHELFIVVLVLVFLHVFFINKQVNASILLSLWIYGWMAVAAFSYFYIRVLYWFIGPSYEYVVDSIQPIRQTWNVYLEPENKHILYKPGQFVYISFDNPTLGKEVHPFSISSYPVQSFIRLSIKDLGDYTSRMNNLKRGDRAWLWGPYGRFYEKYLCERKDAVFLAGGIGITPFMSMLGFEAHHPSERKTYVLYCVKDQTRADFNAELVSYAASNPAIIFEPHYSATCGLLDLPRLEQTIHNLKEKNYFLCGPKPMMDSLINQLTGAGVKNNHIVAEDFNFL